MPSKAAIRTKTTGLKDVKYAAAAGLLLGWQRFLFAILIASVAGALFMVISNRVTHADKRKEYPFGPFLVVGTLAALFFGKAVIAWYIGLLLQ